MRVLCLNEYYFWRGGAEKIGILKSWKRNLITLKIVHLLNQNITVFIHFKIPLKIRINFSSIC